MGVYIPNMEKPKDCYLCEFTNGYECWSNGEPWFDVKEAYAKGILSPDCPLIEIDLVRCGECKWWESAKNGWNGWCKKQIDAYATFYADDFCSYGERRADEHID